MMFDQNPLGSLHLFAALRSHAEENHRARLAEPTVGVRERLGAWIRRLASDHGRFSPAAWLDALSSRSTAAPRPTPPPQPHYNCEPPAYRNAEPSATDRQAA